MAKSEPVGNQDNNKRGRDIEPKGEGRPAKPDTKLSGKSGKAIDHKDVEGYGIGGRGKK